MQQCFVNTLATMIVAYAVLHDIYQTKNSTCRDQNTAANEFYKTFDHCAYGEFITALQKNIKNLYDEEDSSKKINMFLQKILKREKFCAQKYMPPLSQSYLSTVITFSLMSSITSNALLSFIKYVVVSKPLTAIYTITFKRCYSAIAIICLTSAILGEFLLVLHDSIMLSFSESLIFIF